MVRIVGVSKRRLAPPPFVKVHILSRTELVQRSRLTGKTYGPFFRCEVVRIPRDIAEYFIATGIAEEIPPGGLEPRDVERLWELWLEIVRPVLGESAALASRTEFLTKLDPRLSFEDNRRVVEFEANRFIEIMRFRPFLPFIRRGVEMPGVAERITRVFPEVVPPGVALGPWALPGQFPEEWEKFLREEVGIDPERFKFFSMLEQRKILDSFVGWLRRRGFRI